MKKEYRFMWADKTTIINETGCLIPCKYKEFKADGEPRIASNKIYADSDDFLSSTTQFASVILREKGQYRIFAYIDTQPDDLSKGLAATKFLAQGADGVQWFTTKGLKVTLIINSNNKTKTIN